MAVLDEGRYPGSVDWVVYVVCRSPGGIRASPRGLELMEFVEWALHPLHSLHSRGPGTPDGRPILTRQLTTYDLDDMNDQESAENAR
jgi:hypothetical protein